MENYAGHRVAGGLHTCNFQGQQLYNLQEKDVSRAEPGQNLKEGGRLQGTGSVTGLFSSFRHLQCVDWQARGRMDGGRPCRGAVLLFLKKMKLPSFI